ncbi:MAG: hypothetical protein KF780_14080 [Sphingomonas sp.]|nr:hypothetical protein [Sphingomonas sp.]
MSGTIATYLRRVRMGGLYDILIAAGFGVVVLALFLALVFLLRRWLPARAVYFLMPVALVSALISFVREGWLSASAASAIGIVALILLFREWSGARDKAKIAMPRS